MTDVERRAKEKEWRTKQAILAHSIAEQITSIPNITFQGALEMVDLARGQIERDMKWTRAYTSPEIRDRWGAVIEMPQDIPQGKEDN